VPRLATDGSASFVAQTNYDWWLADPPSDPRRLAAAAMLDQLSSSLASDSRRDLGPLDAFAVSSAYPVHNPHTAYTAVMRAGSDGGTSGGAGDSMQAYVRVAMCPKNAASAPYTDPRYCVRL
jgi:hypothetical protein